MHAMVKVHSKILRAIEWYKKSAEQGNVNAQYNLANLYLRGQGAAQDDKTCF